METKIKVVYKELTKLTPYPNNPRTISEESLADLCQSIIEDPIYFETRPIICSNRTGKLVIVAGEKRFFAAQKISLKNVPVAVIPDLTEEDEKRILFKDNGSFGEWDKEALKEWDFDFSQLNSWGVDIDFFENNTLESNEFPDGDKIAKEGFEQAANLKYVQFPGYKIPISDEELNSLNKAVQTYMEDNGTLIGFINNHFPNEQDC